MNIEDNGLFDGTFQARNVCLQDVVAPLYARLLAEAAKRLGPQPAFYELWPRDGLAAPWDRLVSKLYKEVCLSYSLLVSTLCAHLKLRKVHSR
jgi:hypothetical protein